MSTGASRTARWPASLSPYCSRLGNQVCRREADGWRVRPSLQEAVQMALEERVCPPALGGRPQHRPEWQEDWHQLWCRVRAGCLRKNNKRTVAKLQGTDVFHLESAERKQRGGGWREMEGGGGRAETGRGEVLNGWEGDWRSEKTGVGRGSANRERVGRARDSKGAARPQLPGTMTTTVRLRGKPG